MGRVFAVIAVTAAAGGAGAMMQSTNEQEEIKKTALDYVEGWYDANAERMERALHPDLAKRVLSPHPKSGKGKIEQMSAMTLVQMTRARSGKPTPAEERTAKITVLDVFGTAACVRADMHDWIDYMHMTKIDGKWKIVNVLWEPTPEAKKKWGYPESY